MAIIGYSTPTSPKNLPEMVAFPEPPAGILGKVKLFVCFENRDAGSAICRSNPGGSWRPIVGSTSEVSLLFSNVIV